MICDIYILLLPDTHFHSTLLNSTDEDIERIVDRLQKITNNQECDFEDLVEELIERNRKSIRLAIKSNPSKGLFVDYEGRFKSGPGSNSKEWFKWIKENPNVLSVISVSLPVYDPESKIVLIYVQEYYAPGGANGGIIIYRYENGKATYLGGFMLWI